MYNPSFQESQPKFPLAGVQTKYENELFSIVIQSQHSFTLIRAHNRNREINNARATATTVAAATYIGSEIGTILITDNFQVLVIIFLHGFGGKRHCKALFIPKKTYHFYLPVFIKPFILSIEFWLHSCNSN